MLRFNCMESILFNCPEYSVLTLYMSLTELTDPTCAEKPPFRSLPYSWKQKGLWHRVSIITIHLGIFWLSGQRVFAVWQFSYMRAFKSMQCQPKQQWIDDFISNDLDVSYFTALSSDCLAIISTWNFYSSVVKALHNDTPNPTIIQTIWIWKKRSQQTSSIQRPPNKPYWFVWEGDGWRARGRGRAVFTELNSK